MGMGAGTKGGGGGQVDPKVSEALKQIFKTGKPLPVEGTTGGIGKGGSKPTTSYPPLGKGGSYPNNPVRPAAVPATTPVGKGGGKGGGVPLSQQPTLTTGRPFDFSTIASPGSNVGSSFLNRSAPPAPNVSSTLQSPLQPYSGPQAGNSPPAPQQTGIATLPGVTQLGANQ